MVKKVNKKIAEKANQKKEKDYATLFIPACLFIGMGLGFVFYNFIGGLFLGLGAGFLLFAIVNLMKKRE